MPYAASYIILFSVNHFVLIDWLILALRLASSIAAIFWTRTCSIKHTNYIEMRKGMDQPNQRHLTATEKDEELAWDEKLSFCGGYNVPTLSLNLHQTF